MGTVELRRFGDREVRLTNLEKVLFPSDGITKRDVLEHVIVCQEPLLSALRRRPLSMERYVDGVDRPGFFHKHVPKHFPEWVATVETPTSKGPMRQVVVDDLATLALVTNFGCLTPHVPTSTVDRPFHPDQLIVDLDPSTRDVPRIRDAARATREVLAALGLPAFARWTGSKGIHVVVPLDGAADARVVDRVCERVARELVGRWPEQFTVEFAKVDRGDRIYVDMGRNAPGATCVVSFAIRPRPGAPLATPIRWEELDDTEPTSFSIRDGRARLAIDAWRGFEEARVDLCRLETGG